MERTYTIPLRKEYQKVPTYKKSKKAMKAIKEFIIRHMKAKNFEAVKVQNEVNEAIWTHGIRNPPHHIKINAKKLDDGDVLVQLFGLPFPEAKQEAKKQGIAAKMAEKLTGKKAPEKKDEHANHDHAKSAAKPTPAPAAKPLNTTHKPNQENKR
jgi:ribosomal protein L31E